MQTLLLTICCFIASASCLAQEHNDSTDIVSQQVGNVVDSVYVTTIKEQLDNLLDNDYFAQTQIGLMVYDLTADSVLYTHNHRQILRPGSIMKLLTSITALNKLGGNYNYLTSIYHTDYIVGHTLQGDLYCRGGFDPTFNDKMMNQFISSIKNLGIDTIAGNIYADVTFKDDMPFGSGWCWDDDNFTLTPLIYNRTGDFMKALVNKLAAENIVFNHNVSSSKTPSKATIIDSIATPIGLILDRMLKQSDNLYAESMLYQLAATIREGASAKDGISVIRNLLDSLGIDAKSYKIVDGSGLSLYNYLTAEIECKLLRFAYKKPEIYQYLYPALSVTGRDGTMQKRMKGTNASNNVHAKTGTLTGVSTLAGYCTSANGNQLCFAIFNQGIMKGKEAHYFQNRICQILTKCRGIIRN